MSRTPQAPIAPPFLQRCSPRPFTGPPTRSAQMTSLFEASQLAPPTTPHQPSPLFYGMAASARFQANLPPLVTVPPRGGGRGGALIAVLSAQQAVAPGTTEAKPSPLHAFDTGAAWMSLALQAESMGWRTHAMGGFDAQALRQQLGVPEGFAVQCVVAVGEQGPRENLPAPLQEREVPNGRQPLEAMVAEGRFNFQA